MKISFLNLARHRIVRIWQSYFPEPLTEDEHIFIRDNLENPLLALFYSQPLCDQRHGLLVLEKCNMVFKNQQDRLMPSEREILLASLFHDVAKRNCKFSVSQRVIFATLLIFIPNRNHESLLKSPIKILRRVGVYVDHARLSYETIKSQTNSDFVKNVTLYHHGIQPGVELSDTHLRQIELFIQADTL